jgi:hypothetical protein
MVQINVRPLRPQKSQCTQTVRNLHEAPDLSAPHHIAPSRNIAAIRDSHRISGRELVMLHRGADSRYLKMLRYSNFVGPTPDSIA